MELERQVFRQYQESLVDAICDSVVSVAGRCHARGLIRETYDKVMRQDLIPKEKARLVLSAMEKCIATNCANYYDFVDILGEELPTSCNKPLSDMSSELKNMRDRGEVHPCTETVKTQNSVVDVPRSSSIKATVKSKQRRLTDGECGYNSDGNLSRSWSTDSGISVGRSDSLVGERSGVGLAKLDSIPEDRSPIEETPLDKSCTILTKGVSDRTELHVRSSMTDQIFGVEQAMRHLRYEAMQREAVESALRDDLKQLQEKLDKATEQKIKAESTLREKEREIRKLEDELEMEKLSNQEEIDGLKASREDLRIRLNDSQKMYQQDIQKYKLEADTLKTEIRDLERNISDLRHQLERRNCEAGLCYKRNNSMDLKEEIQRKDDELREREAEVKAQKHQLDQYKKRKKDKIDRYKKQLNNELILRIVLIILIIMVAMAALAAHYYRDNHCPMITPTTFLHSHMHA